MAQTPTCPRCGYDLSGIVASWTNSCPLTGICSECGLKFRWGAVLMPLLRGTIELLDSAARPNIHCLLQSVLGCYRPWVLWPQAVEGRHFRLRRTLIVAAVGLVATHALLVVLAQFIALVLTIAYSAATGSWPSLLNAPYLGSWPYTDWSAEWWDDRTDLQWIAFILLWSLMAALSGITPPSALVPPRIAWRHWMRMWLHSIPTLPILAALVALPGFLLLLPIRTRYMDEWVIAIRLTLLIAWFALWWAFAYSRYLGVARPWFRGVGSSVIGGVIAGFLMGLFWLLRILIGQV